VNAVFGTLAFVALGIRIFVSLQQHIFGYDDSCAVLALVFAVPVTFGQLACGILGFGKDTWAVPIDNIYVIMKVGDQLYLAGHRKMSLTTITDRVLQPTLLLPQLRLQQTLLPLHVPPHLPRPSNPALRIRRHRTVRPFPYSIRATYDICLSSHLR
jgi:hypothetical protein